MGLDKIRFFFQISSWVFPYLFSVLNQRIWANIHRYTYKPLPASQLKSVVVVGGSFAGFQLAQRLSRTLPTGWRVTLVEKNSHLNYLFAFPRFCVLRGYEKWAFIPYMGLGKGAPEGIIERRQDDVVAVKKNRLVLKSGKKLEYEYLVIATGTSFAPPSKVVSTSHTGGQKEFQDMQQKIQDAKRIAVIGGGGVGSQMASDIKDAYRDKDVALIHSRDRLMHTFGKRLGAYTLARMQELGVRVFLNSRPSMPADRKGVMNLHGKEETFDLIIPCTSKQPNSSILSTLSPSSISPSTSRILVRPTLQVLDPKLPHIFALGDVAETQGPKMARAANFQAEVIVQNVLSLVKGQTAQKVYKPNMAFEGAIKMTLGLRQVVMYSQSDNGTETLTVNDNYPVDIGIKRQWGMFGASVEGMEGDEKKGRRTDAYFVETKRP
ncbi:FAD/NAD(P)-binding domain-containing protein [Polyplosphaeria fusca]|uniref:FAD/NAD(P)-binding domain-containing protein n=1 Tax=Polyplosphaeria fusca TaxID=682080 RepID=A0A9P4V633_9PLEO|nr:FAD/NAD(P)-binding domain-containing protein [Polyplosphaeria fusca]